MDSIHSPPVSSCTIIYPAGVNVLSALDRLLSNAENVLWHFLCPWLFCAAGSCETGTTWSQRPLSRWVDGKYSSWRQFRYLWNSLVSNCCIHFKESLHISLLMKWFNHSAPVSFPLKASWWLSCKIFSNTEKTENNNPSLTFRLSH